MLWKMLFFLQDMVRFKIRVSLFEYKSRVKSQDTSSEAAVPHVSSEDSDSRRRSRDQEIRSSRDKTCLPNCDANVTEVLKYSGRERESTKACI